MPFADSTPDPRPDPQPAPARTARCARISLLLLAFCLIAATTTAKATPYTIKPGPHPYDADWPDVYLILSAKCAACHRPDGKRADMTSYEALMDAVCPDGQPLVVPGYPDESAIMSYVSWETDTDADVKDITPPEMPPKREDWLTAGQLATLTRWIENGALEYKLPKTCSTRPLLEIDFPSAKECKICHPRQYEQWSRSMHAYAQHSPIMEAFNLTLVERTGGTIGTFCTRCHTPIGTALGENGSRRNVHRSRLSMEGVTCVACHRIDRPYYKANARMAIKPGQLMNQCMFGPFADAVSGELDAHPSAHRAHLKSAAFCGSCHDVTNPQGVRLEEAFSEWQNSPAAEDRITCQHCHMGPIQGVPIRDCERPLGRAAVVPGVDPKLIPLRHLSDHSFAGPDYSLLPDTEFPEKLDWMYEIDYRVPENLTPYRLATLNSLRRRNRRQLEIADRQRYELLSNAAEISVDAPESVKSGGRLKIHVDVHNKVAGHNFPTGFTAERQAWIELTVFDPYGRAVFRSGDVDRNGDLRDEHSYYVEAGRIPHDRFLENFQSKFVALTTRGTERSVVIPVNRDLAPLNFIRPATGIPASFGRPPTFRVSKSSIPPLRTRGKDYHVRLPDCPGRYVVHVRLNFRHLPPVLLDKIGTPHLKRLLETVVIDESAVLIQATKSR